MVAVLRQNIDPLRGQRSGDGAQLSRLLLPETANKRLSDRRHRDPGLFQRRSGALAVGHQEVGVAPVVDGEDAAALQAHAAVAERLPQQRQRARTIGQNHINIIHGRDPRLFPRRIRASAG